MSELRPAPRGASSRQSRAVLGLGLKVLGAGAVRRRQYQNYQNPFQYLRLNYIVVQYCIAPHCMQPLPGKIGLFWVGVQGSGAAIHKRHQNYRNAFQCLILNCIVIQYCKV